MPWRIDEPDNETEVTLGIKYIRENWAFLEAVLGKNLNLESGNIKDRIFTKGMRMWFYQDTAPSGWSLVNNVGDTVLAVKGGGKAYNVGGGNKSGTWQLPNHTLSIDQIPSHSHGFVETECGTGATKDLANVGSIGFHYHNGRDQWCLGETNFGHHRSCGGFAIGSTGGGQAHNHGNAWRPTASVGIICQKD